MRGYINIQAVRMLVAFMVYYDDLGMKMNSVGIGKPNERREKARRQNVKMNKKK